MKRQLPLLIFLLWTLSVGGWAIVRSDGLGGRPLVFLLSNDPGIYDPQRSSNPVAESIFRHVCEPLLMEDDSGGIVGLLAQDGGSYSSDGRHLTLTLRSGIRFHDGTVLDAQAVVTSFQRLQSLGTSPLLGTLRDVTISALDIKTVIFDLPQPDYDFGRLFLTNPYAAIVSPTTELDPLGLVSCTGPYRFDASLYRPTISIALVRYEEYHWPPAFYANRGAAHIPQLEFRFEGDRDRRLALLLSGEVCVLSLSTGDKQKMNESRFHLYEATGGVTYLGFNFGRTRWQDIRLRQAVALAIDKHALAISGPYIIAGSPLGPTTIGYDPTTAEAGYDYNPERSRALLTDMGWQTEKEVILLIPESQSYRDLASLVSQQLAVVGLRVQVKEVPRAALLAERQDFDLLLFDYAWGDYTALGIFLGEGPRNVLGYADGDVGRLVQQARVSVDEAERQRWIAEAQRVVLRKAIWQPLVVRHITVAVDQLCVTGERQDTFGTLLWHDAKTP